MTRSVVVQNTLSAVVAVVAEVYLYSSYRTHEARFHWFTHFFVGASTALLLMALSTVLRRRPVPHPLIWLVLAHLYAMFPDFLFTAGIALNTGWTCF